MPRGTRPPASASHVFVSAATGRCAKTVRRDHHPPTRRRTPKKQAGAREGADPETVFNRPIRPYLGMITVSITWITPLVELMSVLTILALLIIAAPPADVIVTSPP